MSVASTEHGNPSRSGFNCFNTNTQQTRFVSGLPAVSANYIYQTDPVRDNTCIVHTRVKSHKTSKKSFAAGAVLQTSPGAGGGRG